MKFHIKAKLENRYTEKQLEKLETITYFDPRVKSLISSDFCEGLLKKNIIKYSNTDVSPKQKKVAHHI